MQPSFGNFQEDEIMDAEEESVMKVHIPLTKKFFELIVAEILRFKKR